MDESTKLESPKRNYKTLSTDTKGGDEYKPTTFDEPTDVIQQPKETMSAPNSTTIDKSNVARKEKKDKKNRVPRRVIHFSDGVIEEFSTDSEEEAIKAKEIEDEKKKKALIDPKTLRWIPWMLYYTWFMGSTTLGYCDFIGEKLAWWFGITSPKYYYELQEFQRMKEEEEEEESRRKVDEFGWSSAPTVTALHDMPSHNPSTIQPKMKLEGLSPRTLQESSNPSFQDKRLHSHATIDQHLETVDFDPESQTKHY